MTTGAGDQRRIAAARLERQFLVGKSPHRNAADVVRALAAVQSQDFAGAKWALAMRSDGLDEPAIDAAFDRGDIVRTHVLRPTWHFVAPEDLRWMQALTGHRVERIMASYNVKLGLTPAVFRKSLAVIETSLAEQGPLTRTQLKAELERARTGLTVAECTRGIVMTGTQLQDITLNDKRYFVPRDFELPSKASAAAHLLPNYDEYFIGFKDRSAIGQRLGHSALVTGGNALIAHVVAIDGQLVGGWRRGLEKGKSVLRFELMMKLKRREHSRLKRAVERYAEYTGSAILTSGLGPDDRL